MKIISHKDARKDFFIFHAVEWYLDTETDDADFVWDTLG